MNRYADEKCFCGNPARHKIEEYVYWHDPMPKVAPPVAYLCRAHFGMVMGRANAWLSIESAPRDGTTILAYSPDIDPNIFETKWRAWTGSWSGGGEWIDIWNNDPIETNDGPIFPKLWQPLPALPAAKRGSGA
jgi:hypothetical protein